MTARNTRGRRMLGRVRRGRLDTPARAERDDSAQSRALPGPPRPARPEPSAKTQSAGGWDHTVSVADQGERPTGDEAPLRTRLLALFADPRTDSLTPHTAARTLGSPLQDVETTLDAMAQAGEVSVVDGAVSRYTVTEEQKQQLELMFREAAHELGEHGLLMRQTSHDEALVPFEDDTEEPRLPVTAGLLSLFLPGTGQLLNGDVGRASLVFAVWSLAWITQLSPVITFVLLYAGAEAFFTAKIRSMERRLAKDTAMKATVGPRSLPPKATSG